MGLLKGIFGGGPGRLGPGGPNFADYGHPNHPMQGGSKGMLQGAMKSGNKLPDIPKPAAGYLPGDQQKGMMSHPMQGQGMSLSPDKIPPVTPDEMKILGDLSKRYESAAGGAGAIGNNPGDPGGASYGTYQLSSAKGTLDSFLSQSEYGKQFRGLKPGTSEFNQKWQNLGQKDPKFEAAQHRFVKQKHYYPMREQADAHGIPNHPVINQVLWSMGVQHGGANKILSSANIKSGDNPEQMINKLYNARERFTSGLKSLSPNLKGSLKNRYANERKDALKLLEKTKAEFPALRRRKEATQEVKMTQSNLHAFQFDKPIGEAKRPSRENFMSLEEKMHKPVENVLAELEAKGWKPLVRNGRRTQEQADANARAGSGVKHSKHIPGLAADIVDASGMLPSQYDKVDPQFWKDLRDAAEKHGLGSGMRYRKVDRPHIYWK